MTCYSPNSVLLIHHEFEGGVRCIFVHVYFPHLLGGFLHILTCTCNYMLRPLALREYNLSIPNNHVVVDACHAGDAWLRYRS
jgi:hypothetical protein